MSRRLGQKSDSVEQPNRANGSSADDAPVSQRLCQRVAELRKARGWTLEQLSSASGVSRSMLSEIERNRANPTLGVAHRIAAAFGMTLGQLIETQDVQSKIDVIRSDDAHFLYRADAQCRIRTLSPLHLERDVEFYEVTLRAGASLRSAPHFQGTREVLTVQKGAVRVTSNDETVELNVGDSAHYPADVPHAIENAGETDAVLFLVDLYREA
jgi:transcriptional regulator with XRE-family HTH domain